MDPKYWVNQIEYYEDRYTGDIKARTRPRKYILHVKGNEGSYTLERELKRQQWNFKEVIFKLFCSKEELTHERIRDVWFNLIRG